MVTHAKQRELSQWRRSGAMAAAHLVATLVLSMVASASGDTLASLSKRPSRPGVSVDELARLRGEDEAAQLPTTSPTPEIIRDDDDDDDDNYINKNSNSDDRADATGTQLERRRNGPRLLVACTPGQFSASGSGDDDASGGCSPCPSGSYAAAAGATACTACGLGTYGPATGATSCVVCPAGQYNKFEGLSVCIQCSSGKYSASTGSVACDVCPAGSFCAKGSSAAEPCAGGYFCPQQSSAASSCPAGFYCPAGAAAALPCPGGYSCAPLSAAGALCAGGTYCPSGSAASSSCPGVRQKTAPLLRFIATPPPLTAPRLFLSCHAKNKRTTTPRATTVPPGARTLRPAQR